jgi:alpha-methylacyl-CoA racemase
MASGASSGALAGVRVLDLTRLLPGGFCSLLMADLGADVIKVEDTGAGDYLRWAPPRYDGAEASAGGAMFIALNRGKRSLRVDLKSGGGREVLLRLVRDADVLLESFRPGVLDRLGVGYARLREENPRLVYCAITGYGQQGPLAGRAGHDLNYLARIGMLALGEGPPAAPGGQIADVGGGALTAAFAILAALRERDRSGEGQLVDVSMADGALAWLAMVAGRYFADGVVPVAGGGELTGGLICYRPYRCADGWVTIGALEPKFWRAWCAGVGRLDLVERQFDATALADVAAVFLERTRAQWEAFGAEHDCCVEPVLDLDEALAAAGHMVVEVEQPGAGPVRQLGAPARFSRTPADPARGGAPALGADTRAVLGEAGFSPGEIAALEASGAVAGPADATVEGAFLGRSSAATESSAAPGPDPSAAPHPGSSGGPERGSSAG